MAAGAGCARYGLNGNKVVIIYDIGSYIIMLRNNMFLLVIMLHLTVSDIMSKT